MKKKKRKKHFLAEGILRRCGGIYVAPKFCNVETRAAIGSAIEQRNVQT
jgi:hypothetical protein